MAVVPVIMAPECNAGTIIIARAIVGVINMMVVAVIPVSLGRGRKCEAGESHQRKHEFMQDVHTGEFGVERAIEWKRFVLYRSA